ncbi:MAG: DUF1297 domain-containing protein [Euryarchaeota archaeon]|nr:DUF1297 domain-containing protein [Euryarchaeota archaeon]
MLSRKRIQSIASSYERATVAIFGSHSALEVGLAAKAAGFPTLLLAQRGRDRTYALHNRHLFDEILTLGSFRDALKPAVQETLRQKGAILFPNRSMVAYWGMDAIENRLEVPIYGNRMLLRAEERHSRPPRNQYALLRKAGIRTPRLYTRPEKIDGPVVVKVQRANNPRERAYFYATTPQEYREQARRMLQKGLVSPATLRQGVIEEYIVGPYLNANFHSYALPDLFPPGLDLVGFSDREQANETGFRGLPAGLQSQLAGMARTNEEVAHRGKTLRESKHEMIYRAAERFAETCRKAAPPGLIGLFGLQGALPINRKRDVEFAVFDVSLRIPGDPAIGPTSPQTHGIGSLTMKHWRALQGLRRPYGERRIQFPLDLSMMELEVAVRNGRLTEIVT